MDHVPDGIATSLFVQYYLNTTILIKHAHLNKTYFIYRHVITVGINGTD